MGLWEPKLLNRRKKIQEKRVLSPLEIQTHWKISSISLKTFLLSFFVDMKPV